MILVFGSINIDFVFRTQALPREGETVLTDGMLLVPGGKGANQAVAAARAGARVAMVGCIGQDAMAEPATAGLRGAGVDLQHLRRSERPTGCAAIVVDAAGRNHITVASGANLDTADGMVADALLGPGTTLLLQNEVDAEANLTLARRARSRGASVILNAAPARAMNAALWAGLLAGLVVNETEAAMLAGSHEPEALRQLAAAMDAPVVATLGGDGAMAVMPDGTVHRIGALRLDRVVDTTAAGDSFVGALATALQQGQGLGEALRFASVAGALACTKPGAQTSAPGRAEIEARLGDLAPAVRVN
ncbi:MAG TPA: PfkB family carbohydrate kinase [Microvirga sp.]|jgi:ribokinase|nr:PfkB family carbohydrate kinase [Microvirga sp.]